MGVGSLSPSQAELPLGQESQGCRRRPSGRKSAVPCPQCGPVPSLNLSRPISPLVKQRVRLENFPALKRLSEAHEGQASRSCCLDLRLREPSAVPGGRSTSAAQPLVLGLSSPGTDISEAGKRAIPCNQVRCLPWTRLLRSRLPQPPRLLDHLTK